MGTVQESFEDEEEVRESEFLFRQPEQQQKACELGTRVILSVIERLHQGDLVRDGREGEPVQEHDALLLLASLVEGREGSRWSRLVQTQVESKEHDDGEDRVQEFSKIDTESVHQEEHDASIIVYADLGLELDRFTLSTLSPQSRKGHHWGKSQTTR